MGKHSKNVSGAQGAPTYAERRAWNHGTVTERLGKDALGSWRDCRLTLSPAVDPVCTPQGIIYSRVAILENLLDQKKANKQKLAAFERDVARRELEQATGQRLEKDINIAVLYRQQMGSSETAINRMMAEAKEASDRVFEGKQRLSGAAGIKATAENIGKTKAFWVDTSSGKHVGRESIEKPDLRTRCPATGKPLKLRDLISLTFARNSDGDYVDPITLDILTDASRLVVLTEVRNAPNVMLSDTYKQVVKEEGRYLGTQVDKGQEVVELVSGGTGFAFNSRQLQASKHYTLGTTRTMKMT
jgi:nitric oxide synthase-interacting protein